MIVKVFMLTKYLRCNWFRSIGQLQGPYWGRLWTWNIGWEHVGGCFQRYYFSGLLLTLRASKIDLSLSRESTAPVPKDTAEVLFYHRATWALRRIFPNQIPVWQPVTRIGTASTQPGSWEWRKGLWTIETTRRCWLVPGWILRVCDQGGTEHKTGQRRVQELWVTLLRCKISHAVKILHIYEISSKLFSI